jgi:uncharacterized membrane protein
MDYSIIAKSSLILVLIVIVRSSFRTVAEWLNNLLPFNVSLFLGTIIVVGIIILLKALNNEDIG